MLNQRPVVKLQVVQNDPNTVEAKLQQMKVLKEQMKALEAEFNMLKGEVIEEHFAHNEEYVTVKGLVLATFKTYTERRFNTDKFKTDFADIYEGYREENQVSKFLLK